MLPSDPQRNMRTALERWVEKGTALEVMIATKTAQAVPGGAGGQVMTRPLCVYPKVARYNSSGSTSVAANFTCITDERDFNQTPAPKFGP